SQVSELEQQVSSAIAIAPTADSRESVKFKKRSADGVTVIGTTEDFFVTSGAALSAGRFMTQAESDGGRPVCVIGALVATNLFQNESALGQRLLIDQRGFEVVGVLEKKGGFLSEGGVDNQIVIPLPQFRAA